MRSVERERRVRGWAACLVVAAGFLGESAGVRAQREPIDAEALSQAIEDRLEKAGAGAEASVWLGGEEGGPWFAVKPEVMRPTASAIKTFYLVELFDRYRDDLDEPLPGAAAFLDDEHPAVSHFAPGIRAEIRKELEGASVRRIGAVMMGRAPASNAVYNAAANLTTAALGGPEVLTAAIRRRDPAFATVTARRYMLRDRKDPGDNACTAEDLGRLYQRLATGTLAGLAEPTRAAILDAIIRRPDERLGTLHIKTGELASDPLTQVRAGWWETAKGPVVFVVMLEWPDLPDGERRGASERLDDAADKLAEQISRAGRASLGLED